MSEEKKRPPEGEYFHSGLGLFVGIPPEDAGARQQAQAEKAATLRGERPSEQALRDLRARAQAARDKDRGRER